MGVSNVFGGSGNATLYSKALGAEYDVVRRVHDSIENIDLVAQHVAGVLGNGDLIINDANLTTEFNYVLNNFSVVEGNITTLNASVAGLQADITQATSRLDIAEAELSTATSQINLNTTNITSVTGRVDQIEMTLPALLALDSEVDLLSVSLAGLSNTVSANQTTLLGTINAETVNRTAQFSVLEGQIDAEEAARTAAIASLVLDITALQQATPDVSGQVAAGLAPITVRLGAVESALDLEEAARASADSGLQGQINGLGVRTTQTEAGLADLQIDLADEQFARQNADAGLESQIDALALAVPAASAAAAAAQTTASSKIRTYYQDSAPTAEAVGDLWIDSNDGNKFYRWSGASWVLVQDPRIAIAAAQSQQAVVDSANAVTAAAGAVAIADGKVTTFFENDPPPAEGVGDLWVDTNNGNLLHRWSGDAWVAIQDNAISQAITNAATAQSTADGKIITFYQGSVPEASAVGDLWIDVLNENRLYRWSGTQWIEARDEGITVAQQLAIDAAADAALAQNSANIANDLIDDILSDAVLSRDEKPAIRLERNRIIDEYPTIRARAVALGVSVISYDEKYNDLITFLGTVDLDAATDTPISRTVFSERFRDYFGVRQNVLDNIYNQASKQATELPLGNANRVPFSRMENDKGWAVLFNPNVLAVSPEYNTSARGFRFFAVNTSPTASSQQISVGNSITKAFKVFELERLSVQVRVSISGTATGTWSLEFWTFESDGVTGSAQVVATGTDQPTFLVGLRQGFVTVPANHVFGRFELRFISSAAGTIQVGIAEPMVTSASANQTAHPPFTAGPNAFDGADVTSNNTAAFVNGQTAWATWPGLTPTILEQNLSNAQTDAAQSKLDLQDIADDGKVTVNEKISVRERRTNIQNEFPIWKDRAIDFGVDASVRSNFQASYDALMNYLTAINIDANTKSNVVRADFVAAFNNYALWREKVIEAISWVAAQRAQWGNVAGAGRPEDNADVTAGRTAAAISGQGPWATTGIPVNKLALPQPNYFPYPFAPVEPLYPDQIGWANAGANGPYSRMFRTRGPWSRYNDAYIIQRLNGGAAGENYPLYDLPWNAGAPASVGLNGYLSGGGTFSPYIEFINSAKDTILANSVAVYNAQTERYEINNAVAPANTAFIRLVARGQWQASASYQDMVFWGIKIERGENATPLFETSSSFTQGNRVIYNNAALLDSLRPAEFGSNVTETRTAAAISGQGVLATRNTILPSQNDMKFVDNLIPDNDFRDLSWWGAASLPNVSLTDTDTANWEMPRLIQMNTDRDFDFTSQFFTLERGSTYRIRVRVWNNNGAAGWSGAFWPLIHIPGQAWFSLKHGTSVNPDVADANNAIVALGDTLYQDFYFSPTPNAARVVQFRFKSTARGSHVAIQMHLSKVQRLGRDLIRNTNNLPYGIGEIETGLGTAAAISGQGDLATRNAATLPFGGVNAVVNSDFTRGTFGWRATLADPPGTLGVNLVGWHGRRNVGYFTRGSLGNGDSLDISPDTLWNGGSLSNAPSLAMPVAPGDRVYARALLAPHRSTGQVWVLVFNRTGSLVEANATTGGNSGGAANGENFGAPVETIVTVAHSEAAWAIIMLRMIGTGEANPYLFFAEPALGKLAAGQTVVPPYSPGRADSLADETATAQRSIESQFPVIEIKQGEAGHTGNRTVTHVAKRGTATLSGGTWSLPSQNLGTGSATVNSSTSTVTLSGVVQSGAYSIRYTHTDGIATDLAVNVTYVAAAATGGGGVKSGATTSSTGVDNNNNWNQVIGLTLAGVPNPGRVFLNDFGCGLSVVNGTGSCFHEARLLVNGSVVATAPAQETMAGGVTGFIDFSSLFFGGVYSVSGANTTVTVEMRRTSGSGTLLQMSNSLDFNVFAT